MKHPEREDPSRPTAPDEERGPGTDQAARRSLARGAGGRRAAEAGRQRSRPSWRTTKDRLLRALAETENLRRRAAREVEEAHKYAITGFARELLEVDDNLSRALDSIPPRAREEIGFVKTLADGVGADREGAARLLRAPPDRQGRARDRRAGSITTAIRRCSRSRPRSAAGHGRAGAAAGLRDRRSPAPAGAGRRRQGAGDAGGRARGCGQRAWRAHRSHRLISRLPDLSALTDRLRAPPWRPQQRIRCHAGQFGSTSTRSCSPIRAGSTPR